MAFEPRIAPLPFGDLKSTLLVSNAFMVPQGAADPELASLFLKHLYRQDVQERISAGARFLSVLHPVNAALWERSHLESINIVGDRIENGYFLHEMFADAQLGEELENELELYWAGLENAADLAARLEHLMPEAQETSPGKSQPACRFTQT